MMPDPGPLAEARAGCSLASPRAGEGSSGTPARFRPDLAGAAARDFEAGSYLQDFLVATVVAILLTRLFLRLTGFPRLGGGGLHIAHMLWGGPTPTSSPASTSAWTSSGSSGTWPKPSGACPSWSALGWRTTEPACTR